MKSHMVYIDDKELEVRIYDTRKEMLAGSVEMCVPDWTEETMGGFIPVVEDLGWMMLNLEDITIPILSHECTHAILELLRQESPDRKIQFDWQCDEHEERFCHLQSDLLKHIIGLLNDRI